MDKKNPRTEAKTFSERLRRALAAAGVAPSPTVVAHEFNLRYWGKSVSLYAVRNWLLGHSIPTQDKLRALSQWLDVPPHELRFGTEAGTPVAREADVLVDRMTLADRVMLERYLRLAANDRRVVREVVAALPEEGR